MKLRSVVFGVLACGLVTSVASAQAGFRKKGDFSIGVERAFGFYAGHVGLEEPDLRIDYTSLQFGINRHGGIGGVQSTVARLGFDGLLTDNLTLGGGIGFDSHGGDAEGSMFLIAPRVGYLVPLGRHFSIWPRGGFTFWTQGGTNLDANQLMLTGEVMFTASPSESWAFLFGPLFDLGFAGSQEAGVNRERDRTERLFGASFGVVGFF